MRAPDVADLAAWSRRTAGAGLVGVVASLAARLAGDLSPVASSAGLALAGQGLIWFLEPTATALLALAVAGGLIRAATVRESSRLEAERWHDIILAEEYEEPAARPGPPLDGAQVAARTWRRWRRTAVVAVVGLVAICLLGYAVTARLRGGDLGFPRPLWLTSVMADVSYLAALTSVNLLGLFLLAWLVARRSGLGPTSGSW
jgi:hypothetical protein